MSFNSYFDFEMRRKTRSWKCFNHEEIVKVGVMEQASFLNILSAVEIRGRKKANTCLDERNVELRTFLKVSPLKTWVMKIRWFWMEAWRLLLQTQLEGGWNKSRKYTLNKISSNLVFSFILLLFPLKDVKIWSLFSLTGARCLFYYRSIKIFLERL